MRREPHHGRSDRAFYVLSRVVDRLASATFLRLMMMGRRGASQVCREAGQVGQGANPNEVYPWIQLHVVVGSTRHDHVTVDFGRDETFGAALVAITRPQAVMSLVTRDSCGVPWRTSGQGRSLTAPLAARSGDGTMQ